jgi:hypothetical protein
MEQADRGAGQSARKAALEKESFSLRGSGRLKPVKIVEEASRQLQLYLHASRCLPRSNGCDVD